MEEDIEKYKKDCDLLELTDDELISEAKATIIDAMNRKSDGFRRPEKVALVAIENLIARNKEWEDKYRSLQNSEAIKQTYIPKSKVREKIEEANKEIKQMEQDDIGIGFTLGNRWSDLKAKVKGWEELLQEGDDK